MAPEKDLERGLGDAAQEKDLEKALQTDTETSDQNTSSKLLEADKEEVPRPNSLDSDSEHEEVEAMDAGHQLDLALQRVSNHQLLLSLKT